MRMTIPLGKYYRKYFFNVVIDRDIFIFESIRFKTIEECLHVINELKQHCRLPGYIEKTEENGRFSFTFLSRKKAPLGYGKTRSTAADRNRDIEIIINEINNAPIIELKR